MPENLRASGRTLTSRSLAGRCRFAETACIPIIERQRIEGLCGLPLDPYEDQPGPIRLQGDHGPVEYRHVKVIPLSLRFRLEQLLITS